MPRVHEGCSGVGCQLGGGDWLYETPAQSPKAEEEEEGKVRENKFSANYSQE